MQNELVSTLITEKYRPQTFEDLICANKEVILENIKNPSKIPSFIFTSNSPGTGKTSCAKIVANTLGCDSIFLNASDERGIDTIRNVINEFAQYESSKLGIKRMIFLDESDGITSTAQDALKNPMETYSDNVFFILSCNNISKITKAIRSRCVIVSFDNPDKGEILQKLEYVSQKEGYIYDIEKLRKIVDNFYPDIRSMLISFLHDCEIDYNEYDKFFKAMKDKDLDYLYKKTYEGSFNIMGFNDWIFNYMYQHLNEFKSSQVLEISQLVADTERAWNLSTKLPIIFLANIVRISSIL